MLFILLITTPKSRVKNNKYRNLFYMLTPLNISNLKKKCRTAFEKNVENSEFHHMYKDIF